MQPPLTCAVPFEIKYYPDVDVNGFDLPRSIMKHINRRYKKAYYHFCGNGAIGLHLLFYKLANHVHFSDIYQPALDGCKFTADNHGWSASYSNDLIPGEFDLFIADPPWWHQISSGSDISEYQLRCLFDIDYKSHRDMFAWIPNHLTSDGDAFILRDNQGVQESEWYQLIPPTLTVQNEYDIRFFKSGSTSVRIIDRAKLVHLTLE